MKLFIGFLLAAGLATAARGGVFTNESPADIRIIWAVPTNVWPVDKIWSYKVIPQKFSEAVVSNVMAVGSFTMVEKIKLPPEALAIDKEAGLW